MRTDVDGTLATWAVALGTAARHWLDASAIDRDGHIIGGMAVMRDPQTGALTSLTGLTAFEIDMQGQRIDRDIPSGTGMAEFDYDRDVQVLRGARGRPAINGVGNSVSAGESLRPTGLVDFNAITAAIRTYERQIQSLRATGEGEIPGPRPVDNALAHELDAQVAGDIRNDITEVVLALPVEATEHRLFFRPLNASQAATSHRLNGIESPDLRSFRDILALTGRLADLDEDMLRASELVSVDDGAGVGPWSLYKLLSGKLDHGGENYIIEDGKWYRARRDWIDSLNTRVDGLPLDDSFIGYAHADEEAYNAALAATLREAIVMDRQLVRGDGFSSRIEIADVIRLRRDARKPFMELIHIKRNFSSSSLAHLVNQSTTSAFALVERSVREAVADRIEESTATARTKRSLMRILTQAGPYDPAQFQITIGIIGPWRGRTPSEAIPVLARASLQRAVRQLTARGHTISLARIAS